MKQQRGYPRVTVTPKAERGLAGGHPWVYDTEVADAQPAENGALVDYTPRFNMRPHFENEINAFIDCVKTGKKLPSHIDTVIITAKMMQAIYDSAESHREIDLRV